MAALAHYAVDLVLVSMLLAALQRTSGLHVVTNNAYVARYLQLGEFAYAKFSAWCADSGWFSRR